MGARLAFPYKGLAVTPPIGSIIAWLKTYTNTPALGFGWVECGGQVLSDAASPYNGQTIPDLNGDNRFLQGNSTSGGTGGTTSKTTSVPSAFIGTGTDGAQSDRPTYDHTHEISDARPPFYDVVWIMRVK